MIVAWNSGGYLDRAVEALDPRHADGDMRIVIVDNGSADCSADRVARRFPTVEVVRFPDNRGFAKACNVGASRARDAEYLLFLNPDTCVARETVESASSVLASEARTGICGIALRNAEGSVTDAAAREPTLPRYVTHLLGLDRLGLSFLPRGRYLPAELAEPRLVDQVSGAFFLVRQDLFRRLGGFDERFFLYYEEADFSLRARQSESLSWLATNLSGFHEGEASSRSVLDKRLFEVTRSRVLFVRKHRGAATRAVHLLLTVLVEPITRTIFCLARGDLGGVVVVWRAFFAVYRWLFVAHASSR